MAHYLLRREEGYQIEIYDRLSDPRTLPASQTRSFPITLSHRGKNALAKIDGLLDAVASQGSNIQGSVLRQPKGKRRFIRLTSDILVVDRHRLVNNLLSHLTQKYNSSQVNIHFNYQCTQVDVKAKQVKFQKNGEAAEITVACDLLIGADGARSAVRTCFLNTHLFELQQTYFTDDYKSLYFPSLKNEETGIGLEPSCVHTWQSETSTRLLMVPLADGTCCGTLIFARNNHEVLSLTTTTQVREFFDRNFPAASHLIPDTEIEDFLQRPVARVLTIRCNRYHNDDWVLIIGDAAHAVSPSMGQGCNAALEDVVIFDSLLDEYEDNFAKALPEFTNRRVADAQALWELSETAFPPSKALFAEFLFRRSLARIMHKVFPQWFPLLPFDLVRDTNLSYSEVLKLNAGWVFKVKKAKELLKV
ncbi:MAG: NAD(P)/FAD-dependent oxidoreductase [Oscillatoriaceae cyanobacterium]